MKHICQYCSKEFSDSRPHAKFCSSRCYGLNKRTLPTLTCERCGKDFRSKDDSPRFCGRECYDADRKEKSEQRRQKTCPTCGKVFVDPENHGRNIYCSRECFGLSHRSLELKTCPVCGTGFKSSSLRPQLHCSQKCYSVSKHSIRQCPACSKSFMPKRKHQKYCSRECRDKGRIVLSDRTCPQCNKTFHPRKNIDIFCSEKCYGLWQHGLAKRSGLNFTAAQKRGIKKRDNHKCVKCGSDDKLHIDHILPIALGGINTLDNGQTLCEKCHRKKTAKDIRQIRQTKTR